MVLKIKKIHILLAAILVLTIVGVAQLHALPASSGILGSEKKPLPIVMYHQITKKESRAGAYCVTLTELENDLKHIKSEGYKTVDVADLLAFVNDGTPLPEKPIMLTFDDGHETVVGYLLPLLEKYDMCAVSSVVGSITDFYQEIDDHNLSYSYMTWDEIAGLVKGDRIEIQNHSYDLHKNTGVRHGAKRITGESVEAYARALSDDVGKMQRLVKEKTGYTPTAFAYPFGQYSKESKDILLSLGFKAAFVCEERVNLIDSESTDWLYRLGRYNRPHGRTSSAFFSALLAA